MTKKDQDNLARLYMESLNSSNNQQTLNLAMKLYHRFSCMVMNIPIQQKS
jgi:hypothetical protein